MNKLPCFKAYDIRGRLPDELNEEMVWAIGRAFAEYLKPKSVVIGGDIQKPGSQRNRGLSFCTHSKNARNLMTTEPVALQQDSMLTDAEQIMKEKHIHRLIAVDQEEKVTGPLEWLA